MRQVTYERPKDFVDPFARVKDEDDINEYGIKGRSGGNNSKQRKSAQTKSASNQQVHATSAHVNRVKGMRGSKAGRVVEESTSQSDSEKHPPASSSQRSIQEDSVTQDRDSGDGLNELQQQEQEYRRELAQTSRMTRVIIPNGDRNSDFIDEHGVELQPSQFDILANVRCWLLERRSALVVTASTLEGRAVEAETEVELSHLSSLNGHLVSEILSDESVLQSLAIYLVNSAEICIEDGRPLLLLTLVTEPVVLNCGIDEGNNQGMSDLQHASETEVQSMLRGNFSWLPRTTTITFIRQHFFPSHRK